MDRVEVAGLRIGYERAGHGPPLVFVHGYVGDGPRTWRPQLHGLADDFTVVAWDAPGAGSSSDPPAGTGMAEYADYLAGFINNLGLDNPHIVGLSFGGALALEFNRRHPGIARSLTLVSAYAGWRGSLPSEVADQRLRQALELADLSPGELVDTLLPTMFCGTTSWDVVGAFGASLLEVRPVGFRAMARASDVDLRETLPGINIPTLVVCGDQDVRAPLPVAQSLHSAITDSELVVLKGMGHLCNLEAPDAFNAALRTFLRATAQR